MYWDDVEIEPNDDDWLMISDEERIAVGKLLGLTDEEVL